MNVSLLLYDNVFAIFEPLALSASSRRRSIASPIELCRPDQPLVVSTLSHQKLSICYIDQDTEEDNVQCLTPAITSLSGYVVIFGQRT